MRRAWKSMTKVGVGVGTEPQEAAWSQSSNDSFRPKHQGEMDYPASPLQPFSRASHQRALASR